LNNFQSKKKSNPAAKPHGSCSAQGFTFRPERALDSARCGVFSGRALLSGPFVPKEMT